MTLSGRAHSPEIEAERAHRRRWILIPGVVVLLCVVFGMVSMIGPFHTQEDTISQAYGTGVQKIELDSPGDLDVGRAMGDQVTGEWETHWNYTRPGVHEVRDGDTLRLSLDCSRSVGVECFADLRLAVPDGVALDVTSHTGTVSVRDVSGPVSVDNAGGDVRIDGVNGDVKAASKAGSINLRDIGGDVAADTLSGDIDAHGLGGRAATFDDKSGDISAVFRTVPASVSAQTLSGDVTVRVPQGSGPYQVRPDVTSGDLESSVLTNATAKNIITVGTKSGDVRVGYTDDRPEPPGRTGGPHRAYPPTPPTPPPTPPVPEPS
jgi:hypothetical protein